MKKLIILLILFTFTGCKNVSPDTIKTANFLYEPECLPCYTVTEHAAENIAEALMREPLKAAYTDYSPIPCYVFKNNDSAVSVTCRGGMVIGFRRKIDCSGTPFKESELISAAYDFLKDTVHLGKSTFKSIKYDGHTAVIEMGLENSTSPVKVEICSLTAAVTGYDAADYIISCK